MTFGRDVAAFMDLKLPLLLAIAPSVMIYPKDFVDDLREANGVQNEQARPKGRIRFAGGAEWLGVERAVAAAETQGAAGSQRQACGNEDITCAAKPEAAGRRSLARRDGRLSTIH